MAEKSQIATTIEQSKRLLAAGLDRRSADMMWVVPESNGLWDEDENTPDPPASLKCQNYGRYCDTPAWSLSKLWDICNDSGIGPFNFGGNDFDSSSLIEKLVNWIILGVFDCEVLDEYLTAETIQELNHNVNH